MGKALPRLIAISDGRTTGGGDLSPWLDALAAAGIDGVQIREKGLSDGSLRCLVEAACERLPRECRLLVNGRADIALAAGADGVHLPATGLPLAALRERFGRRLLLGCSTHHPDEVLAARDAGADYAVFGPVYPTPSKARFGTPPGLGGLRRAAATGLPVYALGGVTIGRLAEVADAGAIGAAGIRCFLDSARLAPLAVEAARRFSR